ncbi:MAG: DinB family protein [Rubricoccaceae bacterium]
MIAALASRHAALAARREAFLNALEGLPADVLARAPAPGAWSLAQLAEHLYRVEEQVVAGAERARARPSSRGLPALPRLRAAVLRAVLRLPVRIPAPRGAGAVLPSDAPDMPAVAAAWRALDARRERAFGTMDAAWLRRPAFRHPLLGLMPPHDALAFAAQHFDHHVAQLRRTLEAVAPVHAARAEPVARAAHG